MKNTIKKILILGCMLLALPAHALLIHELDLSGNNCDGYLDLGHCIANEQRNTDYKIGMAAVVTAGNLFKVELYGRRTDQTNFKWFNSSRALLLVNSSHDGFQPDEAALFELKINEIVDKLAADMATLKQHGFRLQLRVEKENGQQFNCSSIKFRWMDAEETLEELGISDNLTPVSFGSTSGSKYWQYYDKNENQWRRIEAGFTATDYFNRDDCA